LDLSSQNIAINYSIYISSQLHVYNFITINTDQYFKLITCSLDRSPFFGEHI